MCMHRFDSSGLVYSYPCSLFLYAYCVATAHTLLMPLSIFTAYAYYNASVNDFLMPTASRTVPTFLTLSCTLSVPLISATECYMSMPHLIILHADINQSPQARVRWFFLFVRMSQWLLPICTPHILIFSCLLSFCFLMLASFIATTIVSHVHTSLSGLLRGFSFIHLLPYYIYSHIDLIYAYYPFMYSTMCMTSSFLCSMLLLISP